jgi:phosphoribosylformimino-5-aminoimidazole carboxamide ribotide isomerase
MTMDLYPSIDLLDGQVVRLLRGNYDAETVYGDDPVAVARSFADQGARWIHVVDLNAARAGGNANLRSIEAICANVSARVQSGGGVRSVNDASERFGAGVQRVVVGSAAIEHPDVVDELAARHPGQVAVGLDARARDVAIHGWTDATGLDLVALAERFGAIPGVGALVVTGIDVDGTLSGPDVEPLTAVLGAVDTPLIASGGVGALSDLQALASVSIEGRRFAGAIVGRAIYEKRFTVEEGIAACSQSA